MNWHDEREDYDDEPQQHRVTTEQLVYRTAAAVWTFGLFQLGICLIGLFLPAMILLERSVQGPRPFKADVRTGLSVAALSLLGAALAGIVLYGSTRISEFRRYPWALVAAVLTTLSFPCVFLGMFTIPLGVWAMIVLLRTDVRARFAAVARGTMDPAPPEAPDARRTDPA